MTVSATASDLEAEYRRIHDDATIVGEWSGYRLWHDVTSTPAYTFHQVFAIHSRGEAYSFRARNGFDVGLAQQMFSVFLLHRPEELSRERLTVLTGVSLRGRPFETLVHVPPQVASLFESQSRPLSQAAAWIVPAYECEFRTGHDAKAFWIALNYGGIDVIDWAREPVPLIRGHLISPWPGGMLRFTRRPFYLGYSSLTYILPAIPASIAGLRLLSTRDTEVIVRRFDDGTFRVTATLASGKRADRVVLEASVVAVVKGILSADTLTMLGGA